MKHPFKIADIVYHFEHGEGVVVDCFIDGKVEVEFDSLPTSQTLRPDTLSFKPWPVAEWERPLSSGWYIVRAKDENENQWPQVARYDGDEPDSWELSSFYGDFEDYEVICPFSNYTHVDEEESEVQAAQVERHHGAAE